MGLPVDESSSGPDEPTISQISGLCWSANVILVDYCSKCFIASHPLSSKTASLKQLKCSLEIEALGSSLISCPDRVDLML